MHLTQGNADATFQQMSYANPAQYLRYCAGYYIYMYIPLNNFVGSSFSMASLVLQGTLSLPVPHSSPSEHIQDPPNNVSFQLTVSFLGLHDTARVLRSVSLLGLLHSFRV